MNTNMEHLSEEKKRIYWNEIQEFVNGGKFPEEQQSVFHELETFFNFDCASKTEQVLLATVTLCSLLDCGKNYRSTEHMSILLKALHLVDFINNNIDDNTLGLYVVKKKINSQIVLAYVRDGKIQDAKFLFDGCYSKDLLAYPEMLEFVIQNGFKDMSIYDNTYAKFMQSMRKYINTIGSFCGGNTPQQVEESAARDLTTSSKQVNLSPDIAAITVPATQAVETEGLRQEPDDKGIQKDTHISTMYRQRIQLQCNNTQTRSCISLDSSDDGESLQWSSEEDDHNPFEDRRNLGRGIQRRRRWTQAEENNLRLGVDKYGAGAWAKILKNYKFNNRTSVNLKDKWRNLTK